MGIPDIEETREKYSLQTNQYNEEGYIQGLASFMCDLLNEVCINAAIDKIKSEKSFLFEEHIIYDRLYADYSVMAFKVKAGIDFVIRCPISHTFKQVEKFIKNNSVDEIVNLKVTTKQRKFVEVNELSKEIKVRRVTEVLITSLLDQVTYKTEDFKWLYKKRWGIETYLDRLKNQLEIERFSSVKSILKHFRECIDQRR